MNAWLLVHSVVLLVACSSATNGDTTQQPTSDAAGSVTDKPVPPGPCDSQHCNVPDLYTCWEWSTNDAAATTQQQQLCTEMGGTASTGPCPKDKQVAGCRTALEDASSGCSVTWAYPPITTENVKSDCTDKSGALVNP